MGRGGALLNFQRYLLRSVHTEDYTHSASTLYYMLIYRESNEAEKEGRAPFA